MILSSLLAASLMAGATPSAKQVYTPVWQIDVVPRGPCFLTLFLPPSETEGCIPWTRRETAGPAFHRPTGLVLVGGDDGKLHAIDGATGKLFYSAPIPGALVATPVISSTAVYFGTEEAHVVRADLTTGELRWDVSVDAEVIEPVVVHEDVVIAVTGLDSVYAFDRKTGDARWVHKHPMPTGITLRGQARPLVVETAGEPRVFVGHATGRLSVLSLATGQILGEYEIGRGEGFLDVDADPVYQGRKIVTASHAGPMVALDVVTGAERWRLDEKGVVRLARAGRFMIVAAKANEAFGVDARTGNVVWRFTFKGGAPTRIVVKGGRAHFGSDLGSVYILDAYSGEPLQYFGSGNGIAADLGLVADMMFVMSTTGRLMSLSNATQVRFVP